MPQPNRSWHRLLLALAVAGAPFSYTLGAPPTTCSITDPNVNLGDYDPAVPTTLWQGSFVLTCSNQGVRVEVRLDAGLYPTPTFSERQMAQGAERLGYNLYLDTVGTIWGDGTSHPSLTEEKRTYPVTLPIFGQIRADQWVPGGTYTDTVTVTLLF